MAKEINGINPVEKKSKETKKTFKKYFFPEIGESIEAENMEKATEKARKIAKK